MRISPLTFDDRMRACAYGFWFESYLGAPEFPASDGLFPMDPELRRRYIAHQARCKARWSAKAQNLGGTPANFKRACIAVRAPWFGHGDVLMRVRGLASALSDPDVIAALSLPSQSVAGCCIPRARTEEQSAP
jgi:hypothetical protein|uniref:hypothetical protein n=2 Tax=Cupriavidus TaxID=106589 RepID=UPI003158D5F7